MRRHRICEHQTGHRRISTGIRQCDRRAMRVSYDERRCSDRFVFRQRPDQFLEPPNFVVQREAQLRPSVRAAPAEEIRHPAGPCDAIGGQPACHFEPGSGLRADAMQKQDGRPLAGDVDAYPSLRDPDIAGLKRAGIRCNRRVSHGREHPVRRRSEQGEPLAEGRAFGGSWVLAAPWHGCYLRRAGS